MLYIIYMAARFLKMVNNGRGDPLWGDVLKTSLIFIDSFGDSVQRLNLVQREPGNSQYNGKKSKAV